MAPVEDARSNQSDDGGAGSRALAVTNYVLGAMACAVLALAIWLPKEIGGKVDWAQRERNWQIAAVIALLAAIIVVLKKRNYALLVLCLSCIFFLASCLDNFHWQGG